MANSRAELVCVLACFLICLTGAQDVSTCPKSVPEGDTLDCTCLGVCSDGTTTPTWPGHADTSASLVVPNINRQQDGDQFVCQLECGGQTSTSTYTLQVAYGPGENDTVIVGPSPFITFNGTQTMTLTCNATANPTLEYRWYGISCENGNTNRTCRYTPNITEDGKAVVCAATNPPKTVQSDSYKFNLFCAPRLPTHVSSDVDKCPLGITEDGFDLLVVANPSPSPDDVTVTYLGDTLDKDIFTLLTIHQHSISLYETKLEVRMTGFAELPDGEYRLSVSNTLGSFHCSFPRMKKNDPKSANIGATAGGTAAALVVIIIIIVIACCCKRKTKYQDKENLDAKHNEGSNHDNDSGIEMNGGSSPLEMSPRQSGDYPPSGQHSGEFRKKSGRAAAYEVTSITSTGKVNIKPAAPQPNAYQDPWDIKKCDMTLAAAPGGPPTLHNLGPKGDEYAMVSNPKNKTTITVGPKGDVYSTVAKHGKGDNTQGPPAKAQGQEDAAASGCPPLPMTPHPLDTPGYATLAQMAPDQGKQGDVTGSSGDAAAIVSPVQNTSSPGDGTDTYDHFLREGHDPKCTSQVPDVQYSHIGNY